MSTTKRYPAYAPSGVLWLGALPVEWGVSRLGHETWVRARLGWKGLKAEEYVDDGYLFLSTPDIKRREIDFSGANRITEERYRESPEIMLRPGDVLLSKDGSLGIVNLVTQLPSPATVNSSIAVLTPGPDVDGAYVRYLLSSAYMKNIVQSLKGGMGVPHLFQWDINRIKMPLPPLDEQRQIARFLDRETAKIDALIGTQEQLIETLRERRVAMIVKTAVKGLDKAATLEDSGVEWLGTVPSAWSVVSLRRVCAFRTGTTPPSEDPENYTDDATGWPWVRPQDLSSETIASGRLTDQGQSFVRPVPAKSVLMGCIGFSLGKVGYVDEAVSTNQQITSLTTTAVGRYLYYLMLAANQAIWATALYNRLPILNNDRLGSLPVPVPPLAEQQQIADYLDLQTTLIDVLIEKARRFIELSKERRSALISAAVIGQIDVRDEVTVEGVA